MNYLRVILGASLLWSSFARASDLEIRRLEKELQATQGQQGMNRVSGEIAEHLDRRLGRLESRILSDIKGSADPADKEEQKQKSLALGIFLKASAKWKEYREAQVEWVGVGHEGGSIQPLMCNLEYIRITKERIRALIESSPDGNYEEFKE